MPIPSEPIVFMKATTCISGPERRHRDAEELAAKLDWEVELGVVIGTKAQHVAGARRSTTSPATAW